ncbi:MAG: A/G-specific adenine glycosylase, partial [Notoacmeibacter sp.]|nr:A/G-specific adenine glycosylase [Notoacmeibacter sp.]
EIMLQQTTVAAVRSYFETFITRWPTVRDLADASNDDVMKAWAGLGYYARARNLKACAKVVAHEHGGRFPDTEDELRALPGIGDYTAAAIAAIAFQRPAIVIDGNVERVVTRHQAIATPLSKAKGAIRDFLSTKLDESRPGDFAQAMMDLGATTCTPKRPTCPHCPLRDDCRALEANDDPERYPMRLPKAAKPVRRGGAFVARCGDGSVLLVRRADKGLLAGMTGVPTTSWSARMDGETGRDAAPFAADWRAAGTIVHVFTHFELRLEIWTAALEERVPFQDGWWAAAGDIPQEALPTVMKKAIEAAMPGATKAGIKKRP